MKHRRLGVQGFAQIFSFAEAQFKLAKLTVASRNRARPLYVKQGSFPGNTGLSSAFQATPPARQASMPIIGWWRPQPFWGANPVVVHKDIPIPVMHRCTPLFVQIEGRLPVDRNGDSDYSVDDLSRFQVAVRPAPIDLGRRSRKGFPIPFRWNSLLETGYQVFHRDSHGICRLSQMDDGAPPRARAR